MSEWASKILGGSSSLGGNLGGAVGGAFGGPLGGMAGSMAGNALGSYFGGANPNGPVNAGLGNIENPTIGPGGITGGIFGSGGGNFGGGSYGMSPGGFNMTPMGSPGGLGGLPGGTFGGGIGLSPNGFNLSPNGTTNFGFGSPTVGPGGITGGIFGNGIPGPTMPGGGAPTVIPGSALNGSGGLGGLIPVGLGGGIPGLGGGGSLGGGGGFQTAPQQSGPGVGRPANEAMGQGYYNDLALAMSHNMLPGGTFPGSYGGPPPGATLPMGNDMVYPGGNPQAAVEPWRQLLGGYGGGWGGPQTLPGGMLRGGMPPNPFAAG